MRVRPTPFAVLLTLAFILAPSDLAGSQRAAAPAPGSSAVAGAPGIPGLIDPGLAARFFGEITVFGRCLDSRTVIYDHTYRPLPRPEDQLSGRLGRPRSCYALAAPRAADLPTLPGAAPAYGALVVALPWNPAAAGDRWEWCTE